MMDIYDFSEHDDNQTYSPSKSIIKQKKRKTVLKKISIRTKINNKRKNNKRKKSLIIDVNNNIENPPLKLKLIRDRFDPHSFKSIQIINNNNGDVDISESSSNFTIDFHRKQSLNRCKLSDGREFAVNDIVWAKISGYPFWPSKILAINLSSEIDQKSIGNRLDYLIEDYVVCIEWLAYDQISYVNCGNLSHFLWDFKGKFNRKFNNRNKKYNEAVSEAKNLCEENLRLNRVSMESSVASCETSCEGDTSSGTLHSHSFSSNPESNQSTQSYSNRLLGVSSNPLSIQSDRSSSSSHRNIDFSHLSQNPITEIDNFTSNWDLPDLGSNLDLESNNHIPEFSDYEDDCVEEIDIDKIELIIDETRKNVVL